MAMASITHDAEMNAAPHTMRRKMVAKARPASANASGRSSTPEPSCMLSMNVAAASGARKDSTLVGILIAHCQGPATGHLN